MSNQRNALFRQLVSLSLLLSIFLLYGVPPTASAQRPIPRNVTKPEIRGETKDRSATRVVASKPDDDAGMIYLNAEKLDVASEKAETLRHVDLSGFSGKRLHLVKFDGPIRPTGFKFLKNTGVEIVDYIPNFAYLVYGDMPSLQRLRELSGREPTSISWDGDFPTEFKLQPGVFRHDEASGEIKPGTERFTVQLYRDETANAGTLALLENLTLDGAENRSEIGHYVNITAKLDADGIRQIAERPDVISIQPFVEPRLNDERQDRIITGYAQRNRLIPGNYLDYLAGKGFTQAQFDTSNFVVNVSDSGIDSGNADISGTPNPNTEFTMFRLGDPGSTSRIVYARPYGIATQADTQGCAGHGTVNATIIGGYVPSGGIFGTFPHADAEGYRYGLGVAPFVKVGSSTIFRSTGTYANPLLQNVEAEAFQSGSRISSNSWGAAVSGAYNSDSQTFDFLVRDAQPSNSSVPTPGNQEYVIIFSAGNSGPAGQTTGSPGTAKNVIAVGASESIQTNPYTDFCGTTGADADNSADIAGFSSRGPTADGRKKPDIVAPGTHVTGGVYQQNAAGPVSGNGTANSCFTGSAVCGGDQSANSIFYPTGQQWYTSSSGTSHSAPAVSGGAALIRQYFINQMLTPPSPAMTKAVLMNSTTYLTGAAANDDLWSNNQGMGLMNLDRAFSSIASASLLRDENSADRFTGSGQTRSFNFTLNDGSKPFRTTLAWTDAPGSTAGNSYVNNLDLEVTVNGQLYLGNVFVGANSSTGGAADPRNNVESVFIPAGTFPTGAAVNVTVKATNISGDGVPGNADALDQDFALLAANSYSETPFVDVTGTSLVSESYVPANNAPDPGETVTFALDIQNFSQIATSGNVTANLLPTGGIVNPSGAQDYGTLQGGASVSKNFTFQVSPSLACGDQITLSFQVQDGSGNLFTHTKTYVLGTRAISNSENFDGVTAPALPAGWTSTLSGAGTGWTTTVTANTSAPNAAFAGNPGNIGESILETPTWTVQSADARIDFDIKFDTEVSSNPTVGYDGAVLEIKIGGGGYQDIVAAGGSFISGAYNATISNCCGNPLTGRAAWSGNSVNFVASSVALPASANGQNVQFRWRMGSDSSVTATGVWIDNVRLFGANVCSTGGQTTASNAAFDFDGDGRSDISVFRPADGVWYLNRSTDGFAGITFGLAGDKLAPADYDGDGKTDIAVWRESEGNFYILNSADNTVTVDNFGLAGDVLTVGDYDGDGKADPAVYRDGSQSYFFYRGSQNNPNRNITYIPWGKTGDQAMPGDFDGDGRLDEAVFRPSNGVWYILQSSTGTVRYDYWGLATDKFVPADYDGDSKTDLAVFRNGMWYIKQSMNGQPRYEQFGLATDIPVPADYDGDGHADVAVYRNGVWYLLRSQSGYTQTQFGLSSDRPVPNAYLH